MYLTDGADSAAAAASGAAAPEAGQSYADRGLCATALYDYQAGVFICAFVRLTSLRKLILDKLSTNCNDVLLLTRKLLRMYELFRYFRGRQRVDL